jgi:predicted N-acyltransferase
MPTVRFHDSIDRIGATAWNTLRTDAHPFVAYDFLAGLEAHGCIRPDWGWQSHHLTLHEGDQLLAAAPLYLKFNSHGEFVFDWSWAGAWGRAGGDYYPKLLCAVPYSPVPGPRLLVAGDDTAGRLRRALVEAIHAETERLGLSSAHANFIGCDADLDAFDARWLPRFDWQFHWHNRGYADFDAFLAALNHKKRKNIRQERARVSTSGLDCTMVGADELTEHDWDAIHTLYRRTFDEKGNHAALTRDFFVHLSRTMSEHVHAALARRDGHLVAMALFLSSDTTLYGRYWGASEAHPGLHFELCYYQGIEWCIRHGLRRFEPGAQGEHKLTRGFLPTRTHSRHLLTHPDFRDAVASALAREAQALEAYRDDLMSHSPYAR